ncbi:MAG: hypothetical protein Q9191_000570 [Dirinaria sp. TL-2023a]
MTIWQRRFAFLEGPGVRVINRVRKSRNTLGRFQIKLESATRETSKARTNVIKTWSLLRRVSRFIGLVRVEPEELYSYNDAIETLDECYKEMKHLEQLYTTIWNNITDINGKIRDLAASKFSADIQSQFGQDGLEELYFLWLGVGSGARSLQKTIDGALLIKKEAATEDDKSEIDTVNAPSPIHSLFDLEGMLAEIPNDAAISGGDWPQVQKQVASRLPALADKSNLSLMLITGTKLYTHKNADCISRTSSNDITRKDIDKAYGINRVPDSSRILLEQMMLIVDATLPGSNDCPAKESGVKSVLVRN